jgi:hypothetical protein
MKVSEGVARDASEAVEEGGITADQRAVWHATEVALGVLTPGYIPKREAPHDIRSLLRWLDDDDQTWPRTD